MKYIDLAANIRESNSRVLRNLPRFLVRIVEKIICQDEMNAIIDKYLDCHGAEFHRQIVKEFNLTLEVEGLENLPENGKCFFVANHPYGILDGMVLTKTVLEKYGDFRAISNDAFTMVPNLKPYMAMVNVYGQTPRDLVEALEKVYCSDMPITHFPAGEVSRMYHGKVQDCPWQKSFINKAVTCQRNIVPFHFHGRNSKRFYLVNILRRALGIKANIELILLPSEIFRKKKSKVRVTIGKPISWQTFDKSQTQVEWAQKVRQHVYDLGVPGKVPELESGTI